MIISCLNCNKKFNIDEKLITENGRLLQCSSCNHKWHYTIPKKENVILSEKNEEVQNNDEGEILINPSLNETTINNIKIKTNDNTSRKLKAKKHKPNIEKKDAKIKYSLVKILNTLLIIIITFVAMILILDAFKNNLSDYVPILIPLLDNLYETFFDIKSFIKDLIS